MSIEDSNLPGMKMRYNAKNFWRMQINSFWNENGVEYEMIFCRIAKG